MEPSLPQSDVHIFMAEQPTLEDEVDAILNAPQLLTTEQLRNLACILHEHLPTEVVYGADFDLAAEVSHQLTAVQAMRRKVITEQGAPMPGISARDLKEVTTASNTILQTLLKAHEKIMGFERQRAMEKAVSDTIKTMPEEFQKQFFDRLEIELQVIK